MSIGRPPLPSPRILPLLGAALLLPVLLLAGCSSDDDGGGAPEQDGHVYVVAGTHGESGNVGDGGPATEALLYWPIDMTMLPNGELIVMDWNNHCIRKISTNGTIQRGSGTDGNSAADYDVTLPPQPLNCTP